MKMTLAQAVKQAVEDDDPKAAAVVVDACRFQLGMNYDQILAYVRRSYPDLDQPSWDDLLYRADHLEGDS